MVRLDVDLEVSEKMANRKPEKRLRERPTTMGNCRTAPKTRLDNIIPGILLMLFRVTKAVPDMSFWEEKADVEIMTDATAEPYVQTSAVATAAHWSLARDEPACWGMGSRFK